MLALLLAAAFAGAQTPTRPSEPGGAVVFTGGASFGYASSVGGEASKRVGPAGDLLLAGAHVWNLTPADVSLRARTIANAVGATAATAVHAEVFDVGFRGYLPWMNARYVRPYALAGGGAAYLRTRTTFAIKGTPTTANALGVQLGRDLGGNTMKLSLLVGGGVVMTPSRRLFIDIGVRYNRIFARPSQIPNDQTLNAVRLQLGAGVRF